MASHIVTVDLNSDAIIAKIDGLREFVDASTSLAYNVQRLLPAAVAGRLFADDARCLRDCLKSLRTAQEKLKGQTCRG